MDLIINEYMASNANTVLDSSGQSHDWIEILNTSNSAISIDGYYLSDESGNLLKWSFPDTSIEANGYLLIWASGQNEIDNWNGIHTNFSINSDGEGIYLSDATGNLIDASPPEYLGPDISFGRIPGNFNWYYFENATPGTANVTAAFSDQTQEPALSHESGIYENQFLLELTAVHPDDEIKYTLDGSDPYENSPTYFQPFEIDENSILRIIVLRENALSSRIYTYSFLFESELSLDMISLATDNDNFFGSQGIYTLYNSGEEIPVHLDYFDQSGSLEWHADLGVQIHAPDSRDQKSLRFYARSEYGENQLEYQLFEQKDISLFKRFILRNGGNDGTELNRTHIRDPFVHRLYRKLNYENAYASYKPVHAFINGAYWGIYNLRERQDEHFIQSNFDISCDSVDFLEFDYTADSGIQTICGDWQDYDSLKSFIISKDLSLDQNYNIVKEWIDIENFIDYQVLQIHIGNQDWLNNNIKFWKAKNDSGKWKWVLWDTEYGLGTYHTDPIGNPNFDFMYMALTWGGWGNDDHTWMLRNLVENSQFKDQFVLRYQDLLNSIFKPEYLLQEFDQMAYNIEADIQYQLDRWGNTLSSWESSLDHARTFMEGRPFHARMHLSDNLETSQNSNEIILNVSNELAGNIAINSLFIDHELPGWQQNPYPWSGAYFSDIEMSLKAIPNPGFEFSHWTGSLEYYQPEIQLLLTESMSLTAVFVPVEEVPVPPVLINEIMPHNSSVYQDESGDYEPWIEIFNESDTPIDIAGLYVTNDLNNPENWKILSNDPELTTIEPFGHAVLIADLNVFASPLHLNFSLDIFNGEVGLYYKSNDGDLIFLDAISYENIDEDKSLGRDGDGDDEWIIFNTPTPNEPNEITSLIDLPAVSPTLIYPNPAMNKIHLQTEITTVIEEIRICHTSGQHIKSVFNFDEPIALELSDLTPGIYFMQIIKSNLPTENLRFVKH